MIRRRELGHALAAAFLAGEWHANAMLERADRAFDPPPAELGDVVRAVLDGYHRPPLDRPRELSAYIAIVLEELAADDDDADADDLDDHDLVAVLVTTTDIEPPSAAPPEPPPRVVRWPTFHPQTVRAPWPVPRIDTVGELAERLELDPGQLAWLADVRGLERKVQGRLRNYTYLRLPRDATPPAPPRVIERPKARLKEIQRWIRREILAPIPVHDAAHGFVRGRSARTHAAVHTSRRVVVRLDLEDFFAAVTAARVYGIFRTASYPEAVAHTLTGLCTNVVPPAESVAGRYRLARRLATPHLPQGAPTSPALANLAAFRLDRRLAGLADAVGARYTRYADDLVVSCDHYLRTPQAMIAAIAAEEGFRVNPAKTRVMGRGRRQTVTGIVVNARPNVPRAEYDLLKAILHNAVRDGPGDLDPAHLMGRIAWVESLNPARGAKLRARFAAIRW